MRCILGKGERYDMKVGKLSEKTGKFFKKAGRCEVKTVR